MVRSEFGELPAALHAAILAEAFFRAHFTTSLLHQRSGPNYQGTVIQRAWIGAVCEQ